MPLDEPTFRKGTTVRFERETVDFSLVQKPKSAVRLELAFCNLTSLDGIQHLSKIQDLQIHYCRALSDISAIEGLTELKRINLYCMPNIERQFSFQRLRKLEDLTFNGLKQFGELRGSVPSVA